MVPYGCVLMEKPSKPSHVKVNHYKPSIVFQPQRYLNMVINEAAGIERPTISN